MPGLPVRTALIIPSRNKRHYLEQTLPAARAAAAHADAELIVVDHESTDGGAEWAHSFLGEAGLVLSCNATTISGVRNHGARNTSAELICFLDSDCTPPVTFLSDIAEGFGEAHVTVLGHQVALVGPSWIERSWHTLHFQEIKGPVRWLPGACLCVRAEAFRAIGGFREDLTTGEDTDFCERIRQAGGVVWSDPRFIVPHLDNPRTLGAFFRKEVWRGMGMLDSASGSWRSRVVVTTLAYIASLLAVIPVLVWLPGGWGIRAVVALGLIAGIPALSVAFRVRQTGRGGNLLAGAALYSTYFLARFKALMLTASR